MLFSDAYVFYLTGQAFWQGNYVGLYPYPLVILFGVLSLLPFPVFLAILLAGSLAGLVAVMKWRALMWIFFVPVLQTLAVGNIDVLYLSLLLRPTPLTLALLTLKPHLFVFALPALIEQRTEWKKFMGWLAVIYLPATLLRPTWPLEWLTMFANDGRLDNGTSTSLLMTVLPVGLMAIILMLISKNKMGGMMAIHPALRAYDFALLAGRHWILIPLSWLVYLLMHNLSAAWVMSSLGLADILIGLDPIRQIQRLGNTANVVRNQAIRLRLNWDRTR